MVILSIIFGFILWNYIFVISAVEVFECKDLLVLSIFSIFIWFYWYFVNDSFIKLLLPSNVKYLFELKINWE